MKYKEIAEKYETSVNTVKSWKQRYNWVREKRNSRDAKKSVHTKIKKCAHKIKGAAVSDETEKEQVFDNTENPALDERKNYFVSFTARHSMPHRAIRRHMDVH